MDPRTLPLLFDPTFVGEGDSEGEEEEMLEGPTPHILTEDDFNLLREDILNEMLKKAKSLKKPSNSTVPDNVPHPAAARQDHAKPSTRNKRKAKQMLRGLNINPKASTGRSDDDAELHSYCLEQLNRFIKDARAGACPLMDEDDEYTDPLAWWKANAVKYDILAMVARKFLAAPATSAPSERIWSRAALILTLRRSQLKDDLVEETEPHLHEMLVHELKYLPQLPVGEGKDTKIDVGAEDPFPEDH